MRKGNNLKLHPDWANPGWRLVQSSEIELPKLDRREGVRTRTYEVRKDLADRKSVV